MEGTLCLCEPNNHYPIIENVECCICHHDGCRKCFVSFTRSITTLYVHYDCIRYNNKQPITFEKPETYSGDKLFKCDLCDNDILDSMDGYCRNVDGKYHLWCYSKEHLSKKSYYPLDPAEQLEEYKREWAAAELEYLMERYPKDHKRTWMDENLGRLAEKYLEEYERKREDAELERLEKEITEA